jgi:superfamily II DNA helicase RecQ
MKLRFFTVPVWGEGTEEETLNQFLAQHRILNIEKHMVQNGAASVWTVGVSYAEAGNAGPATGTKKSKVDYREVLNPEDFAVFAQLRELRKTMSEKDGVPPYAIFTNDQLAELVKRRVSTPAAMREIDGIGDSRVEKYSSPFLAVLQKAAVSEA